MFYIITNLFVPYYSDEIIFFNTEVIKMTAINYKIDDKKVKQNYIEFIDNLVKKNDDILKKIQDDLKNKEDMKNFYLDNEYSEESDNSEDYIKGD
jgi:hypothetical protein